VERKIEKIKENFTGELKNYETKKASLIVEQKKARAKEESLLEEKALHSSKRVSLQRKAEKYASQAIRLKVLAEMEENLVEALHQESQIVDKAAGDAIVSIELREMLVNVLSDIEGIEKSREVKSKEIFEHRGAAEKIIRDHLPALDLKKKAAIQCRHFLDADRITEEMKSLEKKKIVHVQEAEELSKKVAQLKREHEAKTKTKSVLERKLNSTQLEQDERRLDVVEQLKTNAKVQLKNARYLPTEVMELVRKVLNDHLTDLHEEAVQLRTKHGWPEDFKRVPFPKQKNQPLVMRGPSTSPTASSLTR